MDLSFASILPRLFISMAVVIVVMVVAARVMKNRQLSGSGSSLRIGGKAPARKAALVETLGRQGLGKSASVNVIRVGDKTLVLGVTDSNISLLTELDTPREVVELTSSLDTQRTGAPEGSASLPSSEQAWKGLLEQVREITVRRS